LALSRLNEKGWEVLADIATDLMEQKDKAPAKPPAPAETSARFTEEELAAYRKVRDAIEQEAEAQEASTDAIYGKRPEGLEDDEWELLKGLRLEKGSQTSAASPSIA
jgi:hypothetical protein